MPLEQQAGLLGGVADGGRPDRGRGGVLDADDDVVLRAAVAAD
jgi:hypothetical protein